MSSERGSFSLGNIVGGVGNFIVGSGEEGYTLRSMARASISYAKPAFDNVSSIIESGKNSISESLTWRDYQRRHVSGEEATDATSTTAQGADAPKSEFKQKYESLKSKSYEFSRSISNIKLDIDSVSQVISSSKEKIQELNVVSKVKSFSSYLYSKLKCTGILIYQSCKKYAFNLWNLLKSYLNHFNVNCVTVKRNINIFVKCCNNILLNFRNNPLEYPKRFFYLVHGFFHGIYIKVYNYRHPEVHKSRIASIGSSIRNIGFSWRK